MRQGIMMAAIITVALKVIHTGEAMITVIIWTDHISTVGTMTGENITNGTEIITIIGDIIINLSSPLLGEKDLWPVPQSHPLDQRAFYIYPNIFNML
jgi:hypothetical protein